MIHTLYNLYILCIIFNSKNYFNKYIKFKLNVNIDLISFLKIDKKGEGKNLIGILIFIFWFLKLIYEYQKFVRTLEVINLFFENDKYHLIIIQECLIAREVSY